MNGRQKEIAPAPKRLKMLAILTFFWAVVSVVAGLYAGNLLLRGAPALFTAAHVTSGILFVVLGIVTLVFAQRQSKAWRMALLALCIVAMVATCAFGLLFFGVSTQAVSTLLLGLVIPACILTVVRQVN